VNAKSACEGLTGLAPEGLASTARLETTFPRS
ncbi:MAG: hypothetical protein ACI814_000582, partial [Mariniblastus sp.]